MKWREGERVILYGIRDKTTVSGFHEGGVSCPLIKGNSWRWLQFGHGSAYDKNSILFTKLSALVKGIHIK